MDIPKLNESTQLLVMCSSKQRPEKLNNMVKSFYECKSEGTELVVYVSDDDPRIKDYEPVLKLTKHIIGPNRNMVQVLNYLSCEAYSGLKYYQELNDDHVIRTHNWDKKMIEAVEKAGGWGWVYGYTQFIPTATLVTGNIIRALGFYLPPQFIHNHVDSVIGSYREIGLLIHVPEVNIEHMHFCFGKSKPDANFDWVNNPNHLAVSAATYEAWVRNQKQSDFNKVLEAIKSSRQNLQQ